MMSRLLSVQNVFGYQMTCASDGFFLNLGWVMLRLAAPFVREGDASRSRLSVIDPLYCATTREQAQQAESGGRILSFASDTGMAPAHSGQLSLSHILCIVLHVHLSANNGHVGTNHFVHCREVVLSSEVQNVHVHPAMMCSTVR